MMRTRAQRAIEVEVRRRLAAWYTAADVDLWLVSPHPQLGGESAASAIAGGRGAEVLAILDRPDAGATL